MAKTKEEATTNHSQNNNNKHTYKKWKQLRISPQNVQGYSINQSYKKKSHHKINWKKKQLIILLTQNMGSM